mmetsp:Transcript_10234/g.17769  ORF Transcript_10234/g.17769 Transcript_10234/m.17769 type:complete len:476 (+) Transcript_10234:1245-2672(+)
MRGTLQVVVVRVLRQSAVVEGPSQVVHRVGLVLDRTRDNLRVEVIVQGMVQMTLDGKRLVQQLLQVLALRGVAHEQALAGLVHGLARSLANHVQNIRNGIIDVSVLSALVVHSVHDDHHVSGDVHSPAKIVRDHQHLDQSVVKQRLYFSAIRLGHTGVNIANTLQQGLSGSAVVQRGHHSLQRRGLGRVRRVSQKTSCLSTRSGESNKVNGSELRLLSGGDKHQHRFARRVLGDGIECRLCHGEQSAAGVVRVVAQHVQLQRHGAHIRCEVENTLRGSADPVSHILCVSKRSGEADHAYGALQLRGDKTGTRNHDLQSGTFFASDQLKIAEHVEGDVLDGLALLPAATQCVPRHNGGDDDVSSAQEIQVGGCLSGEKNYLHAQSTAQTLLPVLVQDLRSLLLACHVHTFRARVLGEQPKDGELGADSLARTSRCANQSVLVVLEERAECLRLNRVEELELRIKRFVALVVEGSHR